MKKGIMLVVLALVGLMMVPAIAQAADDIGALVNADFATSWTYRAGGVPSPPGGWVLAGWGATAGGPQYYTSSELQSGSPSGNRCKWEFAGSGANTNNVIAKEVNWNAYTSITVTVYCAGRTWGGTTGTMSVGIDADGGGTQWSNCGTNVTNRTSNDSSWTTIAKTVSKPAGATTFTVMLNAVTSGTSWNCQFDNMTITGVQGTGTIAGTVKNSGGTGISGATVSTTSGGYTTSTNSSGAYTLANVAPGTYSVVASKAGYNTSTQTGKSVTAGATTTANFTLTTSSNNITNGYFENGFTSGKANNWTSFQSGNFSPTFADGTDQYYEGAHSQKITMPQPSANDKFAGIRQTISTSNGTSYTLSAYARGNMPTETYAGEDLVIRLGYDLTGGTDFTSSNISWQEFNSVKDVWQTLTRNFTATGSSTTIYLQAWRKWAQHGTGYVWFDSVTCTGGSAPGAISGTVKDSSNNAISGATVSTTTGGYTTTTNSSGAYTLSSVTPGTYSVVASKSGYNTNTQTGKTVNAGATTTVNFTLTTASGSGTISGYVRSGTYAAISGATVSTTSGGYSTTTNSSGAYTLSSVAAGTYNVVAVKSGHQTTTIQSETVVSSATTTVNFQMPYNYSKFGWHIVQGARNGFGTFLSTTNGCNKPVAVIKGVDDLAPCAEAKSYNAKTITVGRFCFINGTDYNNLAGIGWVSTKTPQQAANDAWPIHKAAFDPHKSYVDIWEIVNEWDSDYQWQADYMIAMMNKAEADGYRLAIFSSSGGTPSETVYDHIARACARAKQSGGHMLALHEYGFFGDGRLQSQSTSLVTRYRQLYNYLVQTNSECPIILTEVGQGGGYDFVGDSVFLQDHTWYDGQVRQDSYVLGTCAWTLGNWLNANAMSALDEMQTYICNN